MKSFTLATLLLLCGAWLPAAAAELINGWSVQYRQESFSGEIFGGGYVSQSGDETFKAGLAYVCSGTEVTFAYYPGGFNFGAAESAQVAFRGAGDPKTFSFAVRELPNLGATRVLDAAAAAELKAIIAGSGGSIAFREGDTSGTFSTIGADRAMAIIEEECVN